MRGVRTVAYLAIDQGGHSSRAIVFDERGEVRSLAQAPIATLRPAADRVEHDPEEVIESLRTAIGDALQRLPGDVALEAAGLATQRSSLVCWDRRDGQALSPVLSWQDRRNAALVETLRPQAARIHEQTGLVLSAHYGASKMRWCLENLEPVRAAAAAGHLAIGPLSSFVLTRLARERPLVVDPANASRTQLWDPLTRTWSPELLELFGIDAAFLPRPVTSRYAYGTLQVDARTVPLVVATGDQSTVPFAFGPIDADAAYVNLGTGAFIQCPLPAPLRVPPLLTSVVWSDETSTSYVLEGSVNGASSALDWLTQLEGIDAQRLLAQWRGPAQGAHTPLFLNGVSGLASPFWIPDFQSRFVGDGSSEEKFQAVLESILFLIRVNLDEMQHHRARLARLVVTGGLSASDYLCQRLADLTSLEVLRHSEREATARGLAQLIAGESADFSASTQVTRFPPRSDTELLERFFAWLKEMKRA